MMMDSIEFLSDRANPHIDPVLSIWEWQIPAYLFLGGLVAGIMIIGAAQELLWPKTWDRKISVICAVAAAAALSLGMLALLLDLSHKLHVFRFYLAFKPLSPMSWGSWILIFVYPLFALWLLGSLDEKSLPGFVKGSRLLMKLRELAGKRRRPLLGSLVVLGVLLGIYTGILLQALMARPLWNTGLLGPLFLASGMSSGAAFLMLLKQSKKVSRDLLKWDIAVLAVELVLIALFLVERFSGDLLARESALLLVTGPFAGSFFGLVVLAGIIVPLIMEIGELSEKMRGTIAAPLLVLAGSFSFRFILVMAGQVSGYDMVM
ncbi:MAG: NrfD/PsrC family molybdoenzyme membrane anchor subunit [Pseudomonadota bacterium]